MADLISAGVSVTITDESTYIPATSTTVPLFFIATAEEKYQPDGTTRAEGTLEHNKIRLVTSVKESVSLYGIPRFIRDSAGNEYHGDARNEYGLWALNQYLTVGSYAYVIRADVDLNDSLSDVRTKWDRSISQAASYLENMATTYINNENLRNGLISSDPTYQKTINGIKYKSLMISAMADVWKRNAFTTLQSDFESNSSASPLLVYTSGYGSKPSTESFVGFDGMVAQWISAKSGSVVDVEWTPREAADQLIILANQFKYTVVFMDETSLGKNNAARESYIAEQLRKSVEFMLLNDISSETYEFNIIACPGYPSVTSSMVNLNLAIDQEAFVVGDVPFDKDVQGTITWMGNINQTLNAYGGNESVNGHSDLGYYYPHGIGTNLDGRRVFVPSSAIAVKTLAYSDKVSQVWIAPAGVNRGVVTGITEVGYISGELGTPTKFIPLALNKGQRDSLYGIPNNINPIVFFPSRGILVWGQKTRLSVSSALDRINVVRLVQYMKRRLRKDAMAFVFEPNDKITRDNLKAMIESFLHSLIVKRGLYDFAVVCDESNNTPDRIDRNELWVDIAIKPVKAVEFIYIPIRVVNTGAQI